MALPTILTLEVATPKGLVLSTQAASVQAPSVYGEFGVLPGHLPLLASVKSGVLRYVVGGKPHVAAVGDGFVEASPDKVLLLTESFALAESIDTSAVQAELTEAEAALKGRDADDPKYVDLHWQVAWARARLTAAAIDAALH